MVKETAVAWKFKTDNLLFIMVEAHPHYFKLERLGKTVLPKQPYFFVFGKLYVKSHNVGKCVHDVASEC